MPPASPNIWIIIPTYNERENVVPITEAVLAAVPDDWLAPQDGLPDPDAHRAAYLDYLTRRLAAHRRIAEEAENARSGA